MTEKSSAPNLALFLDFDNIALGARDAHVRFSVHLLLQRLLEKGKIIVKKAYADWNHYEEYLKELHEAGVELIEIPQRKLSGKNSADIRLAVDAMDLCYSNVHLDTFIIVSGDSDFSALVSKLRESNKSVIGVGMKNSSSRLLIANCDDFLFYDDLAKQAKGDGTVSLAEVPAEKREIFDLLLSTTQGLMREGRHTLYSSLIKDTIKRKQPDFHETNWGYSTFGDLLEDAMAHGLLEVEREARAGRTWVVTSLAKIDHKSVRPKEKPVSARTAPGGGKTAKATKAKSRRPRRKSQAKKAAAKAKS